MSPSAAQPLLRQAPPALPHALTRHAPAPLLPAALAPQLADTCPDAAAALRQLSSSGAFAIGASRCTVALLPEAAGGPGRIMPVPGLFHGAAQGCAAALCRGVLLAGLPGPPCRPSAPTAHAALPLQACAARSWRQRVK